MIFCLHSHLPFISETLSEPPDINVLRYRVVLAGNGAWRKKHCLWYWVAQNGNVMILFIWISWRGYGYIASPATPSQAPFMGVIYLYWVEIELVRCTGPFNSHLLGPSPMLLALAKLKGVYETVKQRAWVVFTITRWTILPYGVLLHTVMWCTF